MRRGAEERRRHIQAGVAASLMLAISLLVGIPICWTGLRFASAQSQPQVIQGDGMATLDPGDAVTVTDSPLQPSEGGPGNVSRFNSPFPRSSVTITNHSEQSAQVTVVSHGLVIRVAAGNAVELTAGEARKNCEYGTQQRPASPTGPANMVACIWGGGMNPFVDFTTVSWDPSVPVTLQVTYQTGWNLVGVPDGTSLAVIDAQEAPATPTDNLFTWQAGDTGYRSTPPYANP